ncbi:ferritin-3, chloroplastic-like [Rutidosis leptorrhynchoides]|uniref:ferritin-3, chloroplastic-like n=1 Tax=Rutidosis leptorrhynchoides TaxID=125765 RepID=UPI003A99A0F7
MSLNSQISSSFNILLKKSDADFDFVHKKLSVLLRHERRLGGTVRCGSMVEGNEMVLNNGVQFKPFEEVQKQVFIVLILTQTSLARQKFFDECEAAINEQINVEYNVCYIDHAMYAYFDRDNVALKGLAKFFKDSSDEEREHAEKLMEYRNKRGGRVKLHAIVAPPSEFDDVEKGDALYAMELALSLEKLVNAKLIALHAIADRNNDPQMADFIESEYLVEQVDAIKKISDYVSQLRWVGKGHGVWHFNQMLLEGAGAV